MLYGKSFVAGLLLVLLSCACWAWQGQCVEVIDGDTIIVMHENKKESLQLYGLECPKKGQDFNEEARKFTSRQVEGKMVRVRPLVKDKYGRTAAWVYAGDLNLNHALVGAGLAWHDFKNAPNPELASLEKEARARRRGLWIDPKPIPPWEYRKSQKTKIHKIH